MKDAKSAKKVAETRNYMAYIFIYSFQKKSE